VKAGPAQSLDLKPWLEAAQHWNFTQRPFHGNSNTLKMLNLRLPLPQLVPRLHKYEVSGTIAESSHATPVKTCISLTIRPQLPRYFTEMLTPSQALHLKGFCIFLGRSAIDLPIEFPAIRAQPVGVRAFVDYRIKGQVPLIV
jgi:hypothetical protein